MSISDDGDEGRDYGPGSFVHLDVASAYSRLASPSTPLEYVTTLTRQFPLNDRTPVDQPRPAIALADYLDCLRSGGRSSIQAVSALEAWILATVASAIRLDACVGYGQTA